MDSVTLARSLIRCPSVTPADAGAIGVMAHMLGSLGFTCHRLRFGEAPDDPVENLFATIGQGAPHFAFAGHTDVVPEGQGWSVDPFGGEIENGILVGRGAADMKSALAAMVTAAAHHVGRGAKGTLSFLITGDEEGPAIHGTDALLRWMAEQGHRPDMCLVGEPTSVNRLGDMMKIGRRGSVNIWLEIEGTQGHVAYPQRAQNPLHAIGPILSTLVDEVWALCRVPDAEASMRDFQRSSLTRDAAVPDYTARLSELAVPTLFINGEKDSLVPLRVTEAAARRVPGAQLHVLKGCRHWAQKENPEEYVAVADRFLQAVWP